MIKAYVRIDSFSSDLVGVHEFVALPFVGSTISVIDKHANLHLVRVTGVRIRGRGVGEDFALANSVMSDVDVLISGHRETDKSSGKEA